MNVVVRHSLRRIVHIDTEDDLSAFHQRAVLIRRTLDDERAALIDHPRPPAAEAADAGFRELFFEGVNTTK